MGLTGAVLVAASPAGPVQPMGPASSGFTCQSRSPGTGPPTHQIPAFRYSPSVTRMIVLPGIRRSGVNADGASASGRTAPMIGCSRPAAVSERPVGPQGQHDIHDVVGQRPPVESGVIERGRDAEPAGQGRVSGPSLALSARAGSRAQAIRACSGGRRTCPLGGHEKDTRAITEGDRIREASRELTPPGYALVTFGHLDRGGR